MELSMREKELLIMFGSERRLDTHKRLQNAIPYMTDSLYKVAATALWNKLYNNICDSQYVLMYWRTRAELSGIESNISRQAYEYTCLRSFISWQSRRKTHNLLHKMCSLSFIQRKRLTNIFNETSKPSSFCCLPIITIGVVDYRHCNQKNLKIYLSTLHKSV